MSIIDSATLINNTPEDWFGSEYKDDKAGDQHGRGRSSGSN